MRLRDAYRILGLEPNTQRDQVTAHYRELVKQMHPDAGGVIVDVGRLVEAYRTIIAHTGAAKPHRASSFGSSIFSLGKLATSSGEAALRKQAVQQLAQRKRYAGAVFLKQALFDTDAGVAYAAATGMISIPGAQVERDLVSLYEQLSVRQRSGILRELRRQGRAMPRFVAYATADTIPEIRNLAQEIPR
ncbi:MAG TPA: DnaJ domain-containing protein [Alkalispirochaeta sp.]|nr:DnaJ domain-containing protein [Alkalispirochaeta sp.]